MSSLEERLTVPPWRNRSLILRVSVGLAAAAAVLSIGLLLGYPRVVKWKKGRVIHLAEEYLRKGDYRSAYLLMEQFVHVDPANYPARRLLARIYEVTAPDRALAEWEILVQAEPANSANHIGFATVALKVGQPTRLMAILGPLQKLEPNSLAYHRLAAAGALAAGDYHGLMQHVERLVAIEPGNPLTQFTQAALQLNSTRPAEVEQGRTRMADFARGNELRIRATLALINDAPRRWPEEKSLQQLYALLADKLKLRGSGPAPDYVRIQGTQVPPPGLVALTAHMEVQRSLSANDAVALAQWLLQTGRGREALYWLDTLDEPMRSTLAIRQSMATCAAGLESWPRLEQLISTGAWGPVPAEAIKQAFIAHALRGEHNESKSGSQWSAAVRLCEQSAAGLQAMQRLAQIWHWPDKQVQVLWILVRQYPGDESAWRLLVQRARAEGNSGECRRIYQAWSRVASTDPVVQAERMMLGLVFLPGEPGLAAGVEGLFLQHPDVPFCRVTQAFSLWQGGRPREAQAVLDAVGVNFAREPRFALVQGLVSTTLGRTEAGDKMFLLLQGTRLLPEELALIAQARKPAP